MRVATEGNRQIVAAVFAFGTDHTGDPPDHRVIKQQAFHRRLQHVDQIVAAADMRQFMQQDGFDLRGGQAREQTHRHENHGTHVPHHDGNLGQAGFEQPNRSREPETAGKHDPSVPARNRERNRRPSGADAGSRPSWPDAEGKRRRRQPSRMEPATEASPQCGAWALRGRRPGRSPLFQLERDGISRGAGNWCRGASRSSVTPKQSRMAHIARHDAT